MNDPEKEQRAVELIEEFMELFPELGNVIIDSYTSPSYLIFCDDEFAGEFKNATPDSKKDKLH